MVGHCKDCRWFQEGYTPQWGACLLAGSSNGQADTESSLAYAADGEKLVAILRVREDFGCVQFAPREEEAHD